MRLLEVRGLTAGYDGADVLHGVDLDLDEGETAVLLGANGAGKTTTLRAITRLLPARSGRVTFRGADLLRVAPHVPARMGLGYVPEGRGILSTLTVHENLEMGAYPPRARAARAANLERALTLFPLLRTRLRDRAGSLSGGQQQMLAIARALMASPSVLLLDEPSLGLAPRVVREVYAALAELRRGGQAILLVEQNAAQALSICDRGYVLDRGRVAVSGVRGELVRNPRVTATYLGL